MPGFLPPCQSIYGFPVCYLCTRHVLLAHMHSTGILHKCLLHVCVLQRAAYMPLTHMQATVFLICAYTLLTHMQATSVPHICSLHTCMLLPCCIHAAYTHASYYYWVSEASPHCGVQSRFCVIYTYIYICMYVCIYVCLRLSMGKQYKKIVC